MRGFGRGSAILLLPAVVFLALLFIYPLLRMAGLSVGLPSVSLASYGRFFAIPSYVGVLVRTVVASGVVTVVCGLIGVPTAMFLARAPASRRGFLLACVALPYLTSLLVRTYAWMIILNDDSPFNALLLWLGVIDQPLGLLFSTTGAMIGMVHLMLPAMILPVYAVISLMDPAQMRAAAALGGGPLRCFAKVFLPQSLPGIASGATLVFALSLGFYITPAALGSPRDVMLSNLITTVIGSSLDFRFASAMAMLLLGLTLVCYAVVGLLARRRVTAGLGWVWRAVAGEWLRRRAAARWAVRLGRASRWPGGGGLLFSVYGYGVLFLLVLPSVMVVVMSFSDETILSFPPTSWSLRWYREYLSDPLWLDATWTSFRVGLASMVLSLLLGGPAAYGLVRGAAGVRQAVFALAVAPAVVPSVIIGIGLFSTLAAWGLVNRESGLILALTPGAMAYVVIIMRGAFESFDGRLELASASLGAGWLRTAVKIILPIVASGAAAAAVFAFIYAFDEVVISSFVAGSAMQTLPLKLWLDIQYQLEPVIAAVSTLLMLIPLAALPFFRRGAMRRTRDQSFRA